MTPSDSRAAGVARLVAGEVAVIGLARSGVAAAQLAAREGASVYASDAGTRPSAEPGVVGGVLDRLAVMGIDVQWGAHDLGRIARASLVVVSPGVPPSAPPVAAARDAGVPVVSEVELGLWFLPATRIVAVTGTNGKSTVTALTAHLLQAVGADALAAGNIGLPLSELALRSAAPAWVALELSSFQLHDTHSLVPAVGVLTNLTPDHLDRYPSLEEYYSDKDRLFLNAGAGSVWVTNADDVEVQRRTARVAGAHRRFSVNGLDVDAFLDAAHEEVVLAGSPLLPIHEFPLIGRHNVANALAAALAVASADKTFSAPPAREALARGLRSFRGLPHRLEVVADAGGVVWVNDSKATNVASARVAIDAMTRPAIVLMGGRHKGESYASLAASLARHARLVLAYGESADIIVADLQSAGKGVAVERLGSSLPEVIARVREVAQPGDAVLLSPACSSFDMFKNYEERGAVFRRLARGEA
ncbi:MAG: UDP-N-acetylmuramoyl-L-alanine--D-glutamate ligase [Gemmatimonadaceae bacterium]|nr:UDP-N-acetylmuramoyl-L-alanine--D-glutamate ligase [Gemmatimonadaceae bacterium]